MAPFFGRDRELNELGSALVEAEAGRGALFLLVGEPGIGKTRLADEAARAATPRFSVCWGRCWESGGAPAYWPWTQVLSSALRDRSPGARGDLAGSDAERLAAIVPDLGGTRPGATEGQEARFELFRAVLALLGRLARERPLLLVLDDLHAADQSSLLLLHFVARELRTMPVLVIGTYRDVEARLSPEAGQLLARAGREARTLGLRRLDSDEVASFVRQTATGASDETVRSIFQATQGNPLFVDEVVRALVVSGADNRVGAAVPFGVREAIRQHLALLSEDVRQVLEVAAVVGTDFALPVVAAASARSPGQIATAFEEAMAAGVLVDRGRQRCAFSHGLIREAQYRDLPNSRRMELHRAVAGALDGIDGDKPWAELAHHFLEAGPGHVDRGVLASIHAAEQALDAVAYEDAIARLERARAATEVAPADARTRVELTLAEGLARIRTGEGARGSALCLQAAEAARRLPDPELFARAALGYGAEFTFGLTDPVLVRLLEEALTRLPDADSVLRARVLARLASALQPAADPHEPVRIAREAIAMARRVGDKADLLAVIHAGMSAMMDFVGSDERVGLNLEAGQLADDLGDRPRALRARARLVLDYTELGALAEADKSFVAYERLARELKSTRALWSVPLMRSMRAALEGRFGECERALAEATALAESSGDPTRTVVLLYHRFGLLSVQHRLDELGALARELKGSCAALPNSEQFLPVVVACGLMRAGRRDEARAELQPWTPTPTSTAESSTLGFLAEVSVGIGDRALAARLYPLLAPKAGRLLCSGMVGLFCEGPYDRQLGLLAALLGRNEEATRHFDAAVAICRRLGLRPHLARALFDHAEALAATGDHAAARPRMTEARALAGELALTGLVPRIDDLARRLDDQTPATAPGFALRREGEYWTVAAGNDVVRLKDMRGLQILHRLLSHPDQEFHATDLAGAADGTRDAGDAGQMLDQAAREAYRVRVRDLDDTIREAEELGDALRAERARQEREFVARELARAIGLGGRDRRAASAAERARVAVQKRVRDAIKKIEEEAPALGRHLASTIRTGTFCAYHPTGRRV